MNLIFRTLRALLFWVLVCSAHAEVPSKSIVFVCEHGSVKSLIAASFFNRLAAEQQIDCRAVARGLAPQEAVPSAVADNLKKDGFLVASFKPQALTQRDVDQASAVIVFCELPKELAPSGKVSRWLDIPPASLDYEKAKALMLPRLAQLVASLQRK